MPLLNLPNELLDEIALHFIPSMDGDLASYDPDPDIAACRIALLSLAKTNRWLNTIAIRHLYHTVCFDDLRRLFTFLGTLILNPQLADLVRVLNVFTSLDAPLDDYTDERSEQIFAGITSDMKAHQFLGRCFCDADFTEAGDLTWANCDGYPESACALLLCLTGGLQELYLHLPAWNAGDYDVLAAFFDASHRQDQHPNFEFVPHLSSLSLTADPDASDPLLAGEMPQCLMGNGAIKHLEVFGATLLINEEDEDTSFVPPRWSSLETIRLPYAVTTGEWWYRLCKEARPRLRSIEISLSPRYSEWQGVDKDKPGYNEAFLLCADTLEHLEIGLGLSGSLPCLASMALLRYLELSVINIFPTPDAMRAADICDHLPPSLESISLIDDLWEPWPESDHPAKDEKYTGLLQAALSRLLLGSEQKLPRLKRVRIQVTSSSWGDYHEKASEIRHLCTTSPRFGGSIRIDCVTLQATSGN